MGASYYDSVGLLAICDAIDSVEGIPFKPNIHKTPYVLEPTGYISSTRPSEGVSGAYALKDSIGAPQLPAAYPPVSSAAMSAPQGNMQHHLLLHIPVTVSDPISTGAMTFESEQLAAFNSMGSLTGHGPGSSQLPPPATTLPHQRSSLYPAQSINAPVPHIGGGPGTNSQLGPAMGNRAPPMIPQSMVGMASQGAPSHAQQRISRVVNAPSPYPPRPPMGHPLSSSVSPISGPGSDQFKSEECPLCGRSFRGPKASTHKQQHIRRLHPEHYTPKRGGKKRMSD